MEPRRIELKLTPAQAADPSEVARLAAAAAGCSPEGLTVIPVRRSVDARKGEPKVLLLLDLWKGTPPPPEPAIMSRAPDKKKGRVIIVGAGPAGYFCALELLLRGLR